MLIEQYGDKPRSRTKSVEKTDRLLSKRRKEGKNISSKNLGELKLSVKEKIDEKLQRKKKKSPIYHDKSGPHSYRLNQFK